MSGNAIRLVVLALCLPLLVSLTACMFATDLVSPEFLSALRLDPATVIPPQGRTLVAFSNTTSFGAAFAVVATEDPMATATTFNVESATVLPGGTMVVPFDCPVSAIVPGDLNEDLSLNETAVTVQAAAGDIAIIYTGSALEASRDFYCGDVIEVRLVQAGEGAAAEDFSLQVIVLPGR